MQEELQKVKEKIQKAHEKGQNPLIDGQKYKLLLQQKMEQLQNLTKKEQERCIINKKRKFMRPSEVIKAQEEGQNDIMMNHEMSEVKKIFKAKKLAL